MESLGKDSVWAGNFRGFLNLSLRASGAQLGLDMVDQSWKQFEWAIHFSILQGHVPEQSHSPCRLGQLQVEALRSGTP